MGALLAQLIPTALVGAIAVVPILIVITLLMSDNGLTKAMAFATGIVGFYAVVGAIALATSNTNAGSSKTGSAVTGTIVAVLGALLIVMGIKQLVEAPDPDAPPPKFMTKLNSMSAAGAAGFGLLLGLINFKQLGIYAAGISQIVAADVSTVQSWIAFVILIVIIQIGVIGAILAYVLARDWATKTLEALSHWLVEHNRVISIVLGLVVGTWFLVKGIRQIP